MLQLEIPPRSAYVGLVRLAVAGMARLAGVDEERVDDLKIAVSEACANAVLESSDSPEAAPVSVSWRSFGDRVTVEIGDRNTGRPGRPSGEEWAERQELSAALLRTLVDDCEFAETDAGRITRLTLAV